MKTELQTCTRPGKGLPRLLSKYRKSERGNVAAMAGLTMVGIWSPWAA